MEPIIGNFLSVKVSFQNENFLLAMYHRDSSVCSTSSQFPSIVGFLSKILLDQTLHLAVSNSFFTCKTE